MKPTEPGLPVFCMRALDQTASEFARQAWVKDISETKEAIGTFFSHCLASCRKNGLVPALRPPSAIGHRSQPSPSPPPPPPPLPECFGGQLTAVRKRVIRISARAPVETAPPTFGSRGCSS